MVSATNLLQFNCQHTTVWCKNKKWNLHVCKTNGTQKITSNCQHEESLIQWMDIS